MRELKISADIDFRFSRLESRKLSRSIPVPGKKWIPCRRAFHNLKSTSKISCYCLTGLINENQMEEIG
jgi:hypothetical protein